MCGMCTAVPKDRILTSALTVFKLIDLLHLLLLQILRWERWQCVFAAVLGLWPLVSDNCRRIAVPLRNKLLNTVPRVPCEILLYGRQHTLLFLVRKEALASVCNRHHPL